MDIKLHLEAIAEGLPVSMGVSAITYIFTSSLGIHLEMFLIFAILVCLDISTTASSSCGSLEGGGFLIRQE